MNNLLEGLIIRKLTPDDAETLIENSRIIGAESDNLTFGAEGFPIEVEDERRYIEFVNSSEKSVHLGAFIGESLVADGSLHAMQRRLAHRAELGICVRKPYWSMGIGRRMMSELIAFARNSGIELIDLEVRADNTPAIALYESCGFKKTGDIPAFIKIDGEYFDAITMCLDLRTK